MSLGAARPLEDAARDRVQGHGRSGSWRRPGSRRSTPTSSSPRTPGHPSSRWSTPSTRSSSRCRRSAADAGDAVDFSPCASGRRSLLGLGVVALLALCAFTYMIGGPRNLVGMLRYDQRQEGTLKVGDRAPDVGLLALDGSDAGAALGAARRQAHRPRSSAASPDRPFRRSVERIEAMQKKYGDRVQFLTLYIKEAHPTRRVADGFERDGGRLLPAADERSPTA